MKEFFKSNPTSTQIKYNLFQNQRKLPTFKINLKMEMIFLKFLQPPN